MRLFDTTNIVPGATPVVLPPRSAWTDGRSIDFDRVRRYVAAMPDVEYLILDLEVPALMELNALRPGVKLDQVKRGVQLGIEIIDVVRAERPALKVAWYDADIEQASVIYDAMEARIRRSSPRGDKFDDFFINANVTVNHSLTKLAWFEWANDQLCDLYRAQGFILKHAYFPFTADNGPKREGLIRYQWDQACRHANGEKEAMLLYWPVARSIDPSGELRRNHDAAAIAADLDVMRSQRVRNLCLWKDSSTPAAQMLLFAQGFANVR